MADLSRKMIQRGVERLVSKEIKRVTNIDLDLSDLANKVVDTAKRVIGKEHEGDLPEPLSIGESLVAIGKSVHSFGDLERRIKVHRRDFIQVYRNAVCDFAQVLTAMSDPEHRPGAGGATDGLEHVAPAELPLPEGEQTPDGDAR